MPPDSPDLPARLDSALTFLRNEQRPNGEFPTFFGSHPLLAPVRRFDSTTFATTYVLHALSYVERERVSEMTAKALSFVEAEMERHGVWRYWPSGHRRHREVPPDVDDTCCAAAALRRFGRSLPENQELILANRNRAGLFYTWLAPRVARTTCREYWSVTLRQAPVTRRRVSFWLRTDAAPADIDCVVNANVLHYLGRRAEARPVADLLARALEEGREARCDKWHANACSFYYAVSRAYARGIPDLERMREPLIARAQEALARTDDLAPAEVALAACALLNLGHGGAALDSACRRLAESQGADGGWPAFTLWSGPDSAYGWGSEALTTAFCVEALCRFIAEASRHQRMPTIS